MNVPNNKVEQIRDYTHFFVNILTIFHISKDEGFLILRVNLYANRADYFLIIILCIIITLH